MTAEVGTGKQPGPPSPTGANDNDAAAKPRTTAKRALAGSKQAAAGEEVILEEAVPWPEPVDGAALLDEMVAVFRRHLSLPDGAAEAMALWAVQTYTIDVQGICPMLAITSPLHNCGKSTVLSILMRLVQRPLPTSNITPAMVFRVIAMARPTLLIDEGDTFLGGKDDMRGILNSGHARDSAYVYRSNGEKDYTPRRFPTWGSKVIAQIGDLPPTLASRSISVRMQRATPLEKLERFRSDRVDHLKVMASKAARWARDNMEALRDAEPDVPASLHNRDADNWRPLLAIADQAGGDWPEKSRRVALTLSADADDETAEAMLLADLRDVFARTGKDKMPTVELLGHLYGLEERPWKVTNNGNGLGSMELAKKLRPFGIRPRTIKVSDGHTSKGYRRADFAQAWVRYLPAGDDAEDTSEAASPSATLSPAAH